MGKILTTILDMYLNGSAQEPDRILETMQQWGSSKLRDELELSRREHATLVRKLDISRAECGKLRFEITRFETERDKAQSESKRLGDQLADSPYPKHVADLEAEAQRMCGLIETLKYDLGTARASVRDLCREGAELQDEIETLKDDLGAARAARAERWSLSEEIQRLGDRLVESTDEAERMCGLIETLKDDLGAARAERDHALNAVTIHRDSDGVSHFTAADGSSVSTSTDRGLTWTQRESDPPDESPGYGELGAALTERDEARELLAEARELLAEARAEIDKLNDADYGDDLESLRAERDEAQALVDKLEAEGLPEVEQLQGALLLARGGRVKARELAVASEDALKMFFALEPTSDEHGQRDLYPVRGELIAKFRKVVKLAEVLRLLR